MKDMIDVRKVFHLSCPDREQLIIRIRKRALKENRFDDANEETIRRRLATYDNESKPLLDYYGAKKVNAWMPRPASRERGEATSSPRSW